MTPSFTTRPTPLPPIAVAALGPAVPLLASRLLKLSDSTFSLFTGVGGPLVLLAQGPEAHLPWFDGALYLGAVGPLLLPTWAEPDVHPLLLERALRAARQDTPPGPLAVLFSSLDAEPKPLVVAVGAARPLSRPRVAALAAGAPP